MLKNDAVNSKSRNSAVTLIKSVKVNISIAIHVPTDTVFVYNL